MKEKLIELLESAESAIYWDSSDKGFIEKIADHLIANGVTIQRWIPISDRLPTKEDANEYGYVLVCSKGVGVVEDMEWDHVDNFKDLLRCWKPTLAPPEEDE